MRHFDVWCEGYIANGDRGIATKLFRGIGNSLKEVCEERAKTDEEFARYFNADSMAYWGCRIFDNESDARKSFG